MSIPGEATGSHHDPLDAVIAEYLQQVEVGNVPDRAALLTRHPELADGLREFFADFDRLDRQAGELHLSDAVTEPPGGRPHVRYFGEYELLEVIARGGMGVVYKARQQSLNRLVALKMILHGKLATPRDVARFRAEAEAAANLDHVNIVPIYEVGEHDGQQYYAMRFIEGPSLASLPRGDLRNEVRLVATVAQAVHYAHQHGILHRDLKPSNILLAAGIPFVTDFGLAKRLDSTGDLTRTGETPGTPRYMAPEQAAGRKDLAVAADTYSLGVVLYERLTGSTPFQGDDVLEVLRQVREAEPPRPSVLCPGLDRDLETVCLKCLEKEPAKRYASAEALADDLERWLRGEPILARPVGSVGRFRRWCRRNPVVAGLAGGVAASLLAGIVISAYFAVEANQRANAERAERQRAQAAEDDLEKETAVSLIGPIDPAGREYLSQPEVEALWRLAGTANERLRLRFLEEALRTETTAGRLRHRAAWFVHGAVGLVPQRRGRTERLLAEAMRDLDKSFPHRCELAWVALELCEPGSPILRESAEVILQGWAVETNSELRDAWREILFAGTDRFAPGDTVRLLTKALAQEKSDEDHRKFAARLVAVAGRLERAKAARVLNQALSQGRDAYARRALAEGLAAVAGRLEPAEAARVCAEAARLLNQALSEERGATARRELASGLAAVAGRLEPAEAARLLNQALLSQAKDAYYCDVLATGLVAVAGRLEPAEAARVLNQGLLSQAKDAYARRELAEGLAAVAGQMEPAGAARVCAEAARVLNRALSQAKDAYARRELAEGLAAVAGRLEPGEAARVCAEAARLLNQALSQEKNVDYGALAHGLAALAGRLEPGEAARVCAEATRLLSQRLSLLDDSTSDEGGLASGLVAVAGRLEPAEGARLLKQALWHQKNVNVRRELARRLAAMAGRLEPAEAARVLTNTLSQEKDVFASEDLAKGLAAVAGRLEPAEAAQVLTHALSQEKHHLACPQLAEGLVAVAGRMEPAAATRVCAEAARSCIQALDIESLSRLIHVVDSEEATQVARVITLRSPYCHRPKDLERFLSNGTHLQVRARAVAIAAAIGISAQGPAPSLPLLPAAAEPLPCRLTTQDLVDLLKMPTCVGEIRRVILDQLGNRYHRRFDTHWDFVRYAQERALDLDFTTPPKRPEAKLPPLFED